MTLKFNEIDVENILDGPSNQSEVDINSQGVVEQNTEQPPVTQEAQNPNPNGEEKKPEDEGQFEVDINPAANEEAPENKSAPVQQQAANSSPSPYKLFGKHLYDNGVLSVFDEEKVESLEDLEEAIGTTIDNAIDEYKASLPEPVRRIVEHAEQSGEVNLDAVINTQKAYMDVSKITVETLKEDESLQEKMYAEELRLRGYKEDRIKRELDKAKANETLDEDAVDSLNYIKEYRKAEADRIEKETELRNKQMEQVRQNQLKTIQDTIYSTQEFVPNIKVTKKDQETLYKSMTTVVAQDQNGNPMNAVMQTRSKNPIEFEMMLHYLHSNGVFNIDDKGHLKPDWSFITKGLKTDMVKKTQQSLANVFTPGSAAPVQKQNTDLASSLKEFFGQ
jgi:hypothetical protein